MAKKTTGFSFIFVFSIFTFGSVFSCGSVTHIEISYRALNNFQDIKYNTSYDTIIRQNPSALEAGSAYPDAFYPSICFNGRYHDVSEDTHWTPFIKASLDYIHKYYPKPWNLETQMLFAFIMGSVSHTVADVSWHSLGIPQGFISTMSKINYNGNYSVAHYDADLGGDVLNLFQLNLNYSDVIGEWYVPVYDLRTIYQEYYGAVKINESVIERCTKLQYLSKVGEKLILKKYFPISAKKSTYLVDELYEYFLGGIEDMAAWTRRIWREVTDYLEDPQMPCAMPHSPLYIRCGKARNVESTIANQRPITGKDFLYKNLNLYDLDLDHVVVERTERGIWFKPGPKLKEKVSKFNSNLKALLFENEVQEKISLSRKTKHDDNKVNDSPGYPSAVFSVASKYAKLGRAYAVADLDKDGNEDVIIGAPGYYSPSRQQSGMVFILYGTDYGLNVSNHDIDHAADVRIPGPENELGAHTQFGTSLAVFDFDKDGQLDIAIGAPSYGSANLTYQGNVFIFSIIGRNKFSLRGELTCMELYCNLGSVLSTGDLDSDGFQDLLLSCPYAPVGGEQKGFVGAMYADKRYQGKKNVKFVLSSEDGIMSGSQNYSWLGKSLAVKNFGDGGSFMAIGEPTFRKCARPNCETDPDDIEAVGKVHIMQITKGKPVPYREINGQHLFDMLGSSVAMGRPYDQFTNILAIAGTGTSVKGHVGHVPRLFSQVGSVYLYNISNFYQYPVASFNGDRRFGRFGAQIKFADLNRDGYDDLIIGAPLRTKDYTEELHGAEQGQVYVYLGGPNFPHGEVTTNCGIIHIIEPCPGEKASIVLALNEQQARFGSQIAVLHTKRKINLLVTAEHSSIGARLSGAVAVFDF